MKKFLVIGFLLLLCLGLMTPAFAATDNSLVASGKCGTNANWSLYTDGVMTITGSGKMEDYDYYMIRRGYTPEKLAPWDRYQARVTKIIISDGITRIGSSAFAKLYKVSSVVVPKSVKEIGIEAFDYNAILKDIYFTGSKQDWNAIVIEEDNKPLEKMVMYYNYVQTVSSVFDDVKEDSYYVEAVKWALNHEPQVTNGISANKFGGELTVTRGQAMTFLWRMLGEPTPVSARHPFEDVVTDAYYYEAVLFATNKGITNGTSATTFSPDMTCSYAHVLTYLWRAAGSPDVTNKGTWYDDAMKWAKKNDLVEGISFQPNDDCPRADVVTFLYRYELKFGKAAIN